MLSCDLRSASSWPYWVRSSQNFSLKLLLVSFAMSKMPRWAQKHQSSSSHSSSRQVLSPCNRPSSSHSDTVDAQRTQSCDSAEREESSALEGSPLAARNWGQCSQVVADISDAQFFAIRRRPSEMSTWAACATISTSFDTTCYAKAHISSLRAANVASSAPIAYQQQDYHKVREHYAQPEG